MSGTLIINARHRLRWHQRLLSDASTAMAWGGWLWLWAPPLKSFSWLASLGLSAATGIDGILSSSAAWGFQRSLVALIGTSGTLLVWNRLPARKVAATTELSVRDHARHFQLSEQEIQASRNASVCVVHHDSSGRIVRLERREPLRREPLAA
jgi:poly-beta-1,6-N-acetyl-D-glucosamine biosynthesis protein PgaD